MKKFLFAMIAFAAVLSFAACNDSAVSYTHLVCTERGENWMLE